MRKNPTAKPPPSHAGTHYMTPQGHAVLEKELHWLLHDERPKIVDIVSWAAGNGDRSENGDYIYNKKRLREIDRRARYLTKKLENTKIVDPRQQQNLDRVYFGATVIYAKEDGTEVTVTLVGVDEADFDLGKINWLSPVGKALLKAQEGDTVKVRTDEDIEEIEIVRISYPLD
ncbi:MAG: transcription elongation factor GreB [Micavibrio sp.]|nr:MAG: transcription elongation factor GreB [Micavibrio sp.]